MHLNHLASNESMHEYQDQSLKVEHPGFVGMRWAYFVSLNAHARDRYERT